MIRLAPLLAAAAIALFVARTSYAVGAVLLTPGDTAKIVDVRYAVALSLAKTTRWASLRLERFPGAMAWVLPVRPGARVEEVGDAWFEALELATAPRIVGAACGDGGGPPPVVTEGRPPLGPSVRSLHSAVLDDVPRLRVFARDWGFDLPPEMGARFEEVTARGFVLLALVYSGPAEGTATRTVRIVDDAFPWVPLALTAGHHDPVPVTTFVFADARARLGSDSEIELDGARIAMTKDGATNYATELRAALAAARGSRWAAEAAGHDVLFEGARGPGGVDPIPALAPTYFRLAGGDDHTDASDLVAALSGLDPNAAWISRLSGIVPAGAFGDDLAVTRRDDQRKSPFVVATEGRAGCPVPDGGPIGPEGGRGGSSPPPPFPPPRPPEPPGATDPGTLPPTTPPHQSPVTSVQMSCSCSPEPGAPDPSTTEDSCDGSDPGDASDSDEGCDGSTDDPADESCDGSSDPSPSSGDDSCDGSSSSGSGSDNGCSSGSPNGNDGCSSNSSGHSEGCSTAPSARGAPAKSSATCSTRGRRSKGIRPRVSAITLAVAAVALVVRRQQRRQRRACTGANIGFGQ